MNNYVHGYTQKEATRLKDQAITLDEIIHFDSVWPVGSKILEAGCGVGAQTKIIAPKNYGSKFTSIDISNESVALAKVQADVLNLNNVQVEQGDIFNLKFEDEYFDHVFVCFVLEHLSNPELALKELKRVLKPGGSIMIIEGDHGSTYFHPDSKAAHKAIQCQVELQRRNGGNANIGRELYPIIEKAGFKSIKVSPRQVYVDDSKPDLVEGFTRNTFTAMIEGVYDLSISNGLINEEEMAKGIEDLYKTSEGGGTFCYTFFKGLAIK